MKDKKILKKWWFWVIVAIIAFGIIGSFNQGDESGPSSPVSTTQDDTDDNTTATLPKLNADEYKNKEGLIVYKELKTSGYTVTAKFENQALTDMNGNASEMFEPLDPNNSDDRQSVDAFVVGSLTQNGDNVILNIAHQPTN